MLRKCAMLLGGLLLVLACDLHDHNYKTESMPGVTMPDTQDGECAIACYAQGDEDAMIAGYYVVEGMYQDGKCQPKGNVGDVSDPESEYSKKCARIPNCEATTCWAVDETCDDKAPVENVD